MSAMKDFGDPKYVDVWADDVVTLSLQYSTRWDSLAHVGAESDADGVEVEPGDKDHEPHRHSFLPIHHLRLFRLGVPLGELWYLHELAGWLREHGRSRFLLTAPPLRLPGTVGLPVTPIATV